jgi:hypothetical protein
VIRHIGENLARELPLAELSALVHMSPYSSEALVCHRINS